MNRKITVEEIKRRINLIKLFFLENKRQLKYNEKYKGEPVGNWLNRIRNQTIEITNEEKSELENLGIRTYSIPKEKIRNFEVKALIAFFKENSRLPYPREIYVIKKETLDEEVKRFFVEQDNLYNRKDITENIIINIGWFYVNIKTGHTKLSSYNINELKDAGISISTTISYKHRFSRNITNLIKFYEENKRHPKYNEVYNGIRVGSFLQRIRQNNNILSKEDLELLNSKGINTTGRTYKERRKV